MTTSVRAPAAVLSLAAAAGALIGRIGTGQPFGIGDQTSIPAPGAGELQLGINDDHVGDNAGAFRVTVVTPATTIRRR